MFRIFTVLIVFCLTAPVFCFGQSQKADTAKPFLMRHINALTDESMYGRGYVNNGRHKASVYLQKEFRRYGLQPAGNRKSYVQRYSFPVNTFPGTMKLSFNGVSQVPGKDFIIDAGSSEYIGGNLNVKTVSLAGVKTKSDWLAIRTTITNESNAYYLTDIDTLCKLMGTRRHHIAATLPAGCFIVPQKDKFIWTVSQDRIAATVFYINDDAANAEIKTVSADVENRWIRSGKNDNIAGVIPGEVTDTFIAITAHYDHLGMMGNDAVFPGASDNASGTAMLLYMARYFQAHPQHYSILFIAFSGEEAGLVGSQYFTKHPLVPLGSIKFLTNMDIMGDATDGITVVNATEYPAQYSQLQAINERGHYLPQVKSRGKAANSDHYHFSEAGVPSFFIYTNGGKGFYHDINDKAGELSMNHIDDIAHLLTDFLSEIK
ncbi:MAG: M28 family peptidase [Taibaiella sp.]|nr:M28 family peptidase [Taibaiella sp.]